MGRGGVKYVIGLTGNIATGKSLVASRLGFHGALLIDADRVAHHAMEPGDTAWDQVRERFGEGVLRADGTVDRRALGQIVFDDPAALSDLEAIVHPQVVARIDRILTAQDEGVVVVEAIKLIESGLTQRCQALWVTACSPENQLARLVGDRGLTAEEARRRMDAQPDAAAKVARADILLVNDGSRCALTALADRGGGRSPPAPRRSLASCLGSSAWLMGSGAREKAITWRRSRGCRPGSGGWRAAHRRGCRG